MTTSVVCNRRLSTGRRGGQLQLASAPYRQSISCHFLGGMRWLATSSWCAQRSQFGQICVRAVARASRPWESVESADLTDAPGRRESREAPPTRGGPHSAPPETVCLAPLSRCLSVFHHVRNR